MKKGINMSHLIGIRYITIKHEQIVVKKLSETTKITLMSQSY